MFSVGSVSTLMDWLDSDHVTYGFCDICPCRIYISEQNSKASSKQQEYSSKLEEYSKQAVSLRSTGEYKKSACEELHVIWRLYVRLVQRYWEYVI
jgi:hypothetical protein